MAIHARRSWIGGILCVASLLVFLAASTVGIRSRFVSELLQVYRQEHAGELADRQESYQYSSGAGGFALSWGIHTFEYDDAAEAAKWRKQSGYIYDNRFQVSYSQRRGALYAGGGEKHLLGFGARSFNAGPKARGWVVVLPWPAVVLVSAIAPAIRLRRIVKEYLRNQRRLRGLCIECGYDLRGGGNRCPECGTAYPGATSREV